MIESYIRYDYHSHEHNNIIPLNNNNIFMDSGNRGSYLIDNSTRKTLLEGFQNSSDDDNNSTNSEIESEEYNIIDNQDYEYEEILNTTPARMTSRLNKISDNLFLFDTFL